MITAIDGTAVTDGNVLRNHVAQMQPGTKAQISVLRNGKEETAAVTLAELKAAKGERRRPARRRTAAASACRSSR